MKLPKRWQVECKTCGARKPKEIDVNSISYGWILAIPANLSSSAAIRNAKYWCCSECQENDPEHEAASPFETLDRISADIFSPRRFSDHVDLT